MSDAITKGIHVEVISHFREEDSSPDDELFVFSYDVTIANRSEVTVQLISRHWIITDANGKVEEVKGQGVIGEQPVLEPGESHSYTSFCPLKTPVGSMHGSFQMVTQTGDNFDAVIAPFTLAVPGSLQ